MKSKTTSIGRIVLFLCCMALSNLAKAQSPTYILKVGNESQPTPTTYEFEVYLLSIDPTIPFELQTVQFGLAYDTTILMGGVASYSIVNTINGNAALPVPSELVSAQVPTATPIGGIVYTVSTYPGVKYRYFNCAARTPPQCGNGTVITTVDGGCGVPGADLTDPANRAHPGVRIARFRMTNSVPWRANSTCKHIWSTSGGANKVQTVLQAYPVGCPAGASALNITNNASHINYDKPGSCLIQPNGLILNPTGQNCADPPTASAGGPRATCSGSIQLNGSVGGSATTGQWSSPSGGTFLPDVNTLNAVYQPSATDLSNGSVILTLTSNNPNGAPCSSAVSTAIITFVNSNDGNACTQDVCNSQTGAVSHPPIAGIDDGNACTIDVCNTLTGQTTHDAVIPTSDNNACTQDVCNTANGQTDHPPIAGIDDNNVCTQDVCNSTNGSITHVPNPAINDGNACTTDVCNSLTGQITHDPVIPTSDNNACTQDICNTATGLTDHPPIGGIDDGNACTTDVCNTVTGGITHTPVTPTNDNNACTQDVCNTLTGTTDHPPIAGIDDSNACTTDACNTTNGTISHNPIAGINDGNACTTDVCNTVTGGITHTPVTPTSDNNACTQDVCNTATGTTDHPPIAGIDDSNACTIDVCNSTSGVTTHNPIAGIDDGNACTTDVCNSVTGGVTHTAVIPTNDNNACTQDVCNTLTGNTDHPAIPGIDDSNACTLDACNTTSGTISHNPIAGINDGNACTTDVCNTVTGGITHTPVTPTNDNNACTQDVCNTATGTTDHPLIPGIDDGNPCTQDVCNTVTGGITHTPFTPTSDNNACTQDVCNSTTGGTDHPPIAGIDDGNACTLDACITTSGAITHTLNPAINDGNLCTTDVCNSITGGITHTPVPPTSDNNACTQDICNSATGNTDHPSIPGIDDNNACTLDGCNSTSGTISHNPLAAINDGNACTTDVCNSVTGGITHTPVTPTSDNNACTQDVCNTATGATDHPPIAGINDNNACTVDACNSTSGAITHNPNPTINDGNACTQDACNSTTGGITHTPIPPVDDGNPCTTDVCNTATGNTDHNQIIGCGNCANPPTASAGGPYNPSCGAIQLAGSVGGSATAGTWSSPTAGQFIPNNTTLNAIYKPSAADISSGSVLLTLTSNNPSGAPCSTSVSMVTLSFTQTNDGNECTSDVCNTTTGQASHTPVNFDDGNPCTADACNSSTGIITNTPKVVAHVQTQPAGCNASDGSASATPTGPGYTFLWSPGGQTTNPIAGLAAGTYTVTVTDGSGCTGSASGTVGSIGSGAQNPPCPISGPAGACRGQSGVVYCVVPVPGATSYIWTLPSGASIQGPSHGNCITVRFNSHYNGGQICVKAETPCGTTPNCCLSVPRITDKPAIPGHITGPASLCPNTCATYSIAPVPNATSYLWTATGGLVITSGQGTTSVVVCAPPGFNSGTVSVRAVNCKGTSNKKTKNVTGEPATPLWDYDHPTDNQTTGVCGGTTHKYELHYNSNVTCYTWYAPPNAVIHDQSGHSGNPLFIPTGSNDDVTITFPQGFVSGDVCVTACNSCGTSAQACLTVYAAPNPPVWFNHDSEDNETVGICANSIHEYEISLVAGATCYNWSAPQGAIINDRAGHTGNPLTVGPNVNDVDITFPPGFTTGRICVSSCNACASSQEICLTVSSEAPNAPGSISGPASVCKHSTRAYSIAPVPLATSYTWAVTGGATINSGQGTTNVTVRFNNSTTSNVVLSVKAKNKCGSSSTTTLQISVNPACKVDDNPDMVDNAISDQMISGLSAYPNPTTGKARIVFESNIDAKYRFNITDLLGNVLVNESISGIEGYNEKEINLESVSKGIYIVSLMTDAGRTQRIRLVVE